MDELSLGNRRISSGRPFQTEGPTTEKAQRWRVEILARGTRSSRLEAERRTLRPTTAETGQQSSQR